MFLKAALIRRGHAICPSDVWGHNLAELAKLLMAEASAEFPDEFLATLEVFDEYFDELRYPQELKNVSELGEKEAEQLEDAVKYLLPFAAAPRTLDWSSYLTEAPVASSAFMEGVEDGAVRKRRP